MPLSSFKKAMAVMIPAAAVVAVAGALFGPPLAAAFCAGLGVGVLNVAAIIWLIERFLSPYNVAASRVALALLAPAKFLLLVGVVYFLLVGSGLSPVGFAGGVMVAVLAPSFWVLAALTRAPDEAGGGRLKGVSACHTE
jgi:hypothetical protein